MALELRMPMIRLVDGTGGGGSVKSLETMDRTYVPANPAMEIMQELLSIVPVISAALGSVAGLGAARVVYSHFSVMPKKTAQLFVAGPPVVDPALGRKVRKEELGGSQIHTGGFGAVDNDAETEEEAFEQIRRFLSYLPNSVFEIPPVLEAGDPSIEDRLSKVISPFRTAEIFGVEEIIDPRDTRPLLCEWVETAYRLFPSQLGPIKRGMRP
jgi:acetyl-CoA carboxylase carboxyltransferase component